MFYRKRKRKGNKRTGSGITDAAVYGLRSSQIYPGFGRLVTRACALASASICLVMLCMPELVAKEKKPITKTIAGAVLDAADNPIVGAAVELNDVQAGKKFAKYSQENGKYQFTDLDPKHDYEVQASFKGMASEIRRVSSLDDRRLVVLNLTLTPQ